jgi:aspartate/methionine/tyrosine aminotransferase
MLDLTKRLVTPSLRSDVQPFMVMDVMAAAARLEAAGRRIIHMQVGQPAAAAPSTARAAAQAALSAARIGYTESLGIAPLRRRIAAHYRESYGIDVDPGRVVVTTGSSAGFVLVPSSPCSSRATGSPSRVRLSAVSQHPGRARLRAGAHRDFGREPVGTTPQALIAAHRARPLAGLLFASPANPTGTMMTAEALGALIAAAEGEGIRCISDEIYHRLDYAFPAQTALALSAHTMVINSFSKYFCMTGWRVGWMVAPEALVRPIERLQQNLAISVPTLAQVAALAAFDGAAEMEAIKHGYEDNRRLLVDGLPRAGLASFLPVDGAFYLYADVSRFCDDSFAFAGRMLEEAGVAATPGNDFDPVHGRRYIRFSYAGSTDDMREGVERIAGWLRRG